MNPTTITKNKVVTLKYTLTAEGVLYEHTEPDHPFEYLHGADNVPHGLEKALEGRQVGDKFKVTLSPAQGFGLYDSEAIETLDIEDIPDVDDLEIGALLEFVSDDGDIMMAAITHISEETIVVDFNHPLAGKTITYDVQVLNIRDAYRDELKQGYPRGFGGTADEE